MQGKPCDTANFYALQERLVTTLKLEQNKQANSAREEAVYHYQDNYKKGVVLAGAGAMLLSVDALVIKLTGLSVTQAACWRSLLIAVALLDFLTLQRRTNELKLLFQFGWAGLAISLIGLTCIFIGTIGWQGDLGNVLALLLAASTALLFTLSRRYDQLPRIAAILFGSLLAQG